MVSVIRVKDSRLFWNKRDRFDFVMYEGNWYFKVDRKRWYCWNWGKGEIVILE